MTHLIPYLLLLLQLSGPTATQPATHQTTQRAGPSSAPASQPTNAVPDVANEDLALLVHYARRAFEDKVTGRPDRAARYHPLGLTNQKGIVHLTLRSHGTALAEAESSEMDIVDAAVAAGTLLGRKSLAEKVNLAEDRLPELGIEFEWLGTREYLEMKYFAEGGQWTDELLHAFEPAAEGIGVEFRRRRAWTRPSRVVALTYSPDLPLIEVEREVKLSHSQKLLHGKKVRYFRFWAVHLWQPSATQQPFRLLRGDTLVPPLDINAEGVPNVRQRLDAAIYRMGHYLHYRQNANGAFSHEYNPSANRYEPGNAAAVQLRALVGLASWAAWTAAHPYDPKLAADSKIIVKNGDPAADAVRGIDSFTQYLQPIMLPAPSAKPGQPPKLQPAGLALTIPGHRSYLEISARLLSAMLSVGANGAIRGYAEQRKGLIAGILASQAPDGRILMDLRPEDAVEISSSELSGQDAAAGWALVALAEAAATRTSNTAPDDDKRIEKAMLRALSHYRKTLAAEAKENKLSPIAAAAMARAFALHYDNTNDARLSDMVFEILDRLAALQIPDGAGVYPELCGAVNARRPGLVGADTALYLATFADGLALARRIGDRPRVERYRRATLAAARFVLQLEVREMGCYHIRSPRDVLGGVRTTPWNGRIRADHCANALVALMRARVALFIEDE